MDEDELGLKDICAGVESLAVKAASLEASVIFISFFGGVVPARVGGSIATVAMLALAKNWQDLSCL